MASLRCVYCDLDGTLLGRAASLLHDGEGAFTYAGVRALEACFRANVEFVVFTGRRRAQAAEDARLLGQTAFIYEIGCGVSIDGEDTLLTSGIVPREGANVHDQVAASGAPDLLLERYSGHLEFHDPWHTGRDFTHLFRGYIDAAEANELLHTSGHANLRLVDNGTSHRPVAGVTRTEPAHVYHLLPREASKAEAVRVHMRARGYSPEDCVAIGDSREDLGAAAAVGEFWLVGNAIARDPAIAEAVKPFTNVRIAAETHGAGVHEAIVTALAERY